MTQTVATDPTVTVTTDLPERCDRCGAAGKVRVFLTTGGDLTFCGHHANSHTDTIRTSADWVVIETGFSWGAT
jgi:hypothetical protein